MMRVSIGAVADHFSVDGCPMTLGEFELLQHHDTGAFGHDKAVTILVKRPAGLLRCLVPCRDRPHGNKAAQS